MFKRSSKDRSKLFSSVNVIADCWSALIKPFMKLMKLNRNDSLEKVIERWYGIPGSYAKLHERVDMMLIGSSMEQLLLAAAHIEEGESVALMSSTQGSTHTYTIVPHSASTAVSNSKFFATLAKIQNKQPPTSAGEAELWNDRGFLLYEMGWKMESLECHLRALAIDSNLESAWTNLGRYFMDPEIEDFVLATECLDKALDVNPDSDMALANRGSVAWAQRKFEAAIKFCTHAIEINDKNFFSHYYLGAAYKDLAGEKQGGERLTAIRGALKHFRICQSLLEQKPDVGIHLARYITWCEAQLRR